MDQDIEIINTETRIEKIKNFFKKNLKKIATILLTFIFIIIGIFSFQINEKNKKKEIAEKYNSSILQFNQGEKTKSPNRDLSI